MRVCIFLLLFLVIFNSMAFSDIQNINAERKTADKILEIKAYVMRVNARLIEFNTDINAFYTQLSQADKDKIDAIKPHLTTMYDGGQGAVGEINTQCPNLQ